MAVKEKKRHEREDSELVRRFRSNPLVFIGTIVILVIVIVAFVLVPAIVPEYSRGNSADLTFGYYDKVPISYVPGNYFAQYYDMVVRYRQNSIDPNNYQYASYQIWREAFEAAAIHTAILQEMKKSGYAAPVKTVDRDVAQLPQFQENGRFSAALYQRMDNNARLALWRQVQDDLAKEHFRSDVTGLLKPAAEGEFIGKMASRQRSFDMAVFSVDAYPDSEYTAYAEEHADLFRSIHLSKMTINASEREAKQILAQITDGTISFEDAAMAHSQDGYAERGGDMGIKQAHELIIEIPEEADREKIAALGKGEFSEVIKSGSGWVFYRAEDAAQAADFSDSAALDKVRSYVRNYERGRMEDWAIGQARDFIALVNESDFDDALNQKGMEKRQFGPIPLNYGSIDLFTTLSSASVSELSASASDENFWKTAFSTPQGSPSEPLVQGSNVLVLLPTGETEAEESSIEGIASTYNSYWLSYMSEQAISSYFMNSDKMDDRFMEIYFRYFMSE